MKLILSKNFLSAAFPFWASAMDRPLSTDVLELIRKSNLLGHWISIPLTAVSMATNTPIKYSVRLVAASSQGP